MSAAAPLADVFAEARRLVGLAETGGVPLRLLGGAAIHLRAAARHSERLRRMPQDIDVVVGAGSGGQVSRLLGDAGYEPDEAFNRLEGARRMLFRDVANDRQVDVFVRDFTMCHRIPLEDRLLLEPVTVPLAELMLTKLQIVELNAKDATDVCAMLHAHDVASEDGATINVGRIASLCARDWGLHRTVTLNLGRVRAGLDRLRLALPEADRVRAGIDAIEAAIDAAPKSGRWRLRARVGERVRWYDEPDEVGG